MTIQFCGYVISQQSATPKIKVKVQTPPDFGGHQIEFDIPREQAQYWTPGDTVQFTMYILKKESEA